MKEIDESHTFTHRFREMITEGKFEQYARATFLPKEMILLHGATLRFLYFIDELLQYFPPQGAQVADIDVNDPNIIQSAWNIQAHDWAHIESPGTYYATLGTLLRYLKSYHHSSRIKKHRILSLGSGAGLYEIYLGWLLKTFEIPVEIVALDFAEEMTRMHEKYAKKAYKRGILTGDNDIVAPITGDMRSLSFDHPFHIVICNNSLGWVQEWKEVLVSIRRVLVEPGDVFFFVHPHAMAVQIRDKKITFPRVDLEELFDELEKNQLEVQRITTIGARAGLGQAGGSVGRIFIHARLNTHTFTPWQKKVREKMNFRMA